MANVTLEIHHVNIYGGDAAVVVVRKEDDNGAVTIKKVLVDAGAVEHGAQLLAGYIAENKDAWGGAKFDYIVASHYHDDHIDGFEAANVSFASVIDNGGYAVGGVDFTPVNGEGAGTNRQYFKRYTDLVARVGATRTKVSFFEKPPAQNSNDNNDAMQADPVPLSVPLLDDPPITLTCYCGNGMLANGTNVLDGQRGTKTKLYDPNDLSLAWLLKWDDFTYFTAGDLSGEPAMQKYFQVEEPLAAYLTGDGGPLQGKRVSVLKVNHHGSKFSTYKPQGADGFLDKLQPDTLIIQTNQPKSVPSDVFLERANSYAQAKQAAVVFANEFSYADGDARYPKFKALQTNVGSAINVLFGLKDDGDSAYLENCKAVVVRRQSGGAAFTDPLRNGDQRIRRTGYEVLMVHGTSTRISHTRNATFIVGGSIPTGLADSIKKGFGDLATRAVSWWRRDAAEAQRQGRPYLEEDYPVLVDVLNASSTDLTDDETAQALADKLWSLFTTNYTTDQYGDYVRRDSALTNRERKTLHRALIDNRHQLAVNRKLRGIFTEARAWNQEAGEPYATAGGTKRAAELQLTRDTVDE